MRSEPSSISIQSTALTMLSFPALVKPPPDIEPPRAKQNMSRYASQVLGELVPLIGCLLSSKNQTRYQSIRVLFLSGELDEVEVELLRRLVETVLVDGLDRLGRQPKPDESLALLPVHLAPLQVQVLHLRAFRSLVGWDEKRNIEGIKYD